jgi:hypothetical protein
MPSREMRCEGSVISFSEASCTSKTTMGVPELIRIFYKWQGNSERNFRIFVRATILGVITMLPGEEH